MITIRIFSHVVYTPRYSWRGIFFDKQYPVKTTFTQKRKISKGAKKNLGILFTWHLLYNLTIFY